MDRTGRHEKELRDPLARELGIEWRFIERSAKRVCRLACWRRSKVLRQATAALYLMAALSRIAPCVRRSHLSTETSNLVPFRPLQGARETRYEALPSSGVEVTDSVPL